MKRIVLFLATNLAVVLVVSLVLNLLGVGRAVTGEGIDVGALAVFSLVVGFTGSIISLLMSKPMAKWSTGARVIEQPATPTERWLVDTVRRLSERAGIGMPEVAVYDGEPNAFLDKGPCNAGNACAVGALSHQSLKIIDGRKRQRNGNAVGFGFFCSHGKTLLCKRCTEKYLFRLY